MDIENKRIVLDVAGLGIVFHSPANASHLRVGEDYFASHYCDPRDVQKHIQKGTIVGFGTGSSGTFLLTFHAGYPSEERVRRCRFKLRLGLCCVGGVVCFRDLYDLMDWVPQCPPEHVLELDDGIYHVTLCSDVPESGVIGDNQHIDVYLHPLNKFPRLATEGIPTLCM